MLASSKTGPREALRNDLTSLRELLGPHLRALEQFLQDEAGEFEPEIHELVRYCLSSSGKRIRASLVFLAGWQEGGEVRDDFVRLAAVLELVHLATLVHDDILDSATTRHNRITAARKYGPATAVLLGDALFAHAVNLSTRFPDSEVCRRVSIATRRVCVGEIAQTLRAKSADIGVSDYYRIVDLKTAELFTASCYLGARLGGYSPEYVEAVASFGRQLGIAYQIYDDLVDFFGDEASVGKTLGTDLRSGKLTLPLILLLNDLDAKEKKGFRAALNGEAEPALVERAQTLMLERGIFGQVMDSVLQRVGKAEAALAPFSSEPPTPLLLQVQERLMQQVKALQAEQ